MHGWWIFKPFWIYFISFCAMFESNSLKLKIFRYFLVYLYNIHYRIHSVPDDIRDSSSVVGFAKSKYEIDVQKVNASFNTERVVVFVVLFHGFLPALTYIYGRFFRVLSFLTYKPITLFFDHFYRLNQKKNRCQHSLPNNHVNNV